MRKALHAAMDINAGEIAQQYSEPEKIKQAIYDARLEKVKATM